MEAQQSLFLPFSHLNLRFNPFGELNRADRTALAVADISDLVKQLERPGFAVQFIDDKGFGKTSHLLAIHRHFKEAPYIHIEEGERPVIPVGHPLFLDEAQRISLLRRRMIFRRPVSFVIGSHTDHTRELRRAGISVKTIHPGDLVSCERLQEIFHRRIERARRDPGPVPQVSPETTLKLINLFGNDVRSMENLLYEIFQSLKELDNVAL